MIFPIYTTTDTSENVSGGNLLLTQNTSAYAGGSNTTIRRPRRLRAEPTSLALPVLASPVWVSFVAAGGVIFAFRSVWFHYEYHGVRLAELIPFVDR